MKKRILSLCMAAVLALSCILPASAAETQSGLTVRSVTPADLSQTMGNTTQQMTAQPQDPMKWWIFWWSWTMSPLPPCWSRTARPT